MFGGATNYVETLDAILTFVTSHRPTTDELVGWHRGMFEQVSSRESIQRRIDYLEDVGFIEQDNQGWTLGPEGQEYVPERSTETLLDIMCRRNVGLRSLLYALSVGPMTIEEISRQQLDTHPELGWNPENMDMAAQRANWLRSLGLVEKDGAIFELTDEGHRFTTDAVEAWANTPPSSPSPGAEPMAAGTYEITVQARSVDPEFRATVLSWYDASCPVSGVDHPALLDVAHVLSWSEYPEYRADLTNVLPLSKIHHAAFDRELFTIDQEYRLHVNPEFETESDLLRRTICDQVGETLILPDHKPNPAYLRRHNRTLDWFSA